MTPPNPKLRLKIPDKLGFLLEPHRFKVAFGGRGSAKSWTIAQILITLSYRKPLRILCTREIQGSIKESVLRNTDQIKSTEGIDICWIEEAQNVSYRSWELITPTIRKEDLDEDGKVKKADKIGDFSEAEIWVSFNPEFEDDETYQRFVVKTGIDGVVRKVNYSDNPWFPTVLKKEMLKDKANDYQLYLQKWEGQPVGLGGRVWATYDDEVHVKDIPMELIAEKGNSFCAVDPHSKFYPACIFYAILPKNSRMNWPEDFYIHVYNEFPNVDDLGGYYHEHRKKTQFNGTLKELSTMIYNREGLSYGIKTLKRFCDTRYALGAGSGAIQTTGLMEEWAKPENGGMVFELPPVKMIDIQREVIKNDMNYNKLVEVSQFNEPTFSIAPRCQNLRMSMKNHRLDIDKNGEAKEKESEKFKDFSDALRIGRAGLHDFQYQDPAQHAGDYSRFFKRSGSWNG
jgi:hypothetical protein